MISALHPETSGALARFRARRGFLLHLRSILVLAACALAALAVVALLDRARLLPDEARPWVSLAAYAGAALVAWRLGWRHIGRARPDRTAAALAESAAPALRERLLAAVELASPDRPANIDSPEFRARLQDEVAREISAVSWSRALPLARLVPWLRRLALVAFVLALLSVTPRLHFPGFMLRAALPFADLERPASVRIVLASPSPADLAAPFVSEVEVAADVSGRQPEDLVIIEFQEDGAPLRRVEMAHREGLRFEQSLNIGQTGLRYRVACADGLTSWHRIEARPRPAIETFVKIITPPAYTGWPATELSETHGDIEALVGSAIKLRLAPSQPVSESSVAVNPTDIPAPEPVVMSSGAEGMLEAGFEMAAGLHSWQARLVAVETGFSNPDSQPWRLTPVVDAPPSVVLTAPGDFVQRHADSLVQVAGNATDDVGLAGAVISISVNADSAESLPVGLEKGAQSTALAHNLNLAPMHLRAGDTVLARWIVTDLKGQISESQPVRILILEETVDPALRRWADSQQRLASAAAGLKEQTRQLRDAGSKVQRDASLAARGRPANDPEGQLARLKAALDSATRQADDLWDGLRQAAASAPDALAREEARLLGERVSRLRQAVLPQLTEAASEPIRATDPVRKAASDADAIADSLQKAADAFAAEAAAEIAARSADQVKRQQSLLMDSALEANRDAEQRPRWQERQQAALAAVGALDRDLERAWQTSSDRGQTRALEELRGQLTETAADMRDSIDTPDQKKSPEHLYGAADNLKNRLNRTADHARAMSDTAANRAAQVREQMSRQDNAALAALDEAGSALKEAAKQAALPPAKRPRIDKNNAETPAEKAARKLAEASRQLQDQADLAGLDSFNPDPGALDTNRISRAADQLSRDTASAAKPEPEAAAEKTSEKAPDSLQQTAATQPAGESAQGSQQTTQPGQATAAAQPAADSTQESERATGAEQAKAATQTEATERATGTQEATEVEPAKPSVSPAEAIAAAAENTAKLAAAARLLQTQNALANAATQLDTAALESSSQAGRMEEEGARADAQQMARNAADARAAAETLRRSVEPLKRNRDLQEPAALAAQSADAAREAAGMLDQQADAAARDPGARPEPVEQAVRGSELARQAVEALAAPAAEARATVAALTPALSTMMAQVADDLNNSSEMTGEVAAEAEAGRDTAEVAADARDLQPRVRADAARMNALQAALRHEANQADLAQAGQRQLSRAADTALEQMRQQSPQISGNIRDAAQSRESERQAQALQNAAQAQARAAEALERMAANFAQMEAGQELTDEQLAALSGMEEQLGIRDALDEAYERAEALANLEEMAGENPATALAELERELAANDAMKKALAEISSSTAQSGESALKPLAQQPAMLGAAAGDAAHDLARVARHEQRLGQENAAGTVAEAAQSLRQTAQETSSNPGNATPEMSRQAVDAAQQATAAARDAADQIMPPTGMSALDQVQAAALALALDQLDQTLNPREGQPGQGGQGEAQSGEGQPGQQQGGDSAQDAGQSLADARQSQQQSMADARNQGQVPGSSQDSSMAQTGTPPSENPGQSNEGGNFQTVVAEGDLAGQLILVPGDWGHLPARTAEELTEATRQDAPPEYRAAIESYYRAIATQARTR